MTREDIEKAAMEYSGLSDNSKDPDSRLRGALCIAFKDGANWCINSVWHDASEKPITNKKALVKYISGDGEIKYRVDVFCGYEWKEMCHYDKLIQFAYIEDLTSNTEE